MPTKPKKDALVERNKAHMKAKQKEKEAQEKWICTRCGSLTNNFNKSYSELNKSTNRVAVCKPCVTELYGLFLDKTGDDHKLGLYYLCRLLDIVFDERLFQSVRNLVDKMNTTIATVYIGKTNSLHQYIGKCFADSDMIDELDIMPEGMVQHTEYFISNEMRMRWGRELKPLDYQFLENQRDSLLPRADENNSIQVMYIEDICKIRLEADKARRTNKLKDYDNLMRTLSKLMDDANLKPSQQEQDYSKLTMGEWIAKIEEEEPIPEPKAEFKDPDKIAKYISLWFTQQVSNMLGVVTKGKDMKIESLKEKSGE